MKLSPRITKIEEIGVFRPAAELVPRATRSWFYANEIRTIYNMGTGTPNLTSNINVAVVSFGGGLYGTVNPLTGVLTNGDCQTYWQSIGIAPANMPKVVVIPISGAANLPNFNDSGATIENTIDVEQIGACCPSSNLTIILYISPNSLSQFPVLLNYILNVSAYKPSVISISWGAPEVYYPTSLLNSINTLLSSATSQGINVLAASGDNGSNNGVGGTGNYADCPASCPNVTGCGGTRLVCPNLVYDGSTVETAWSSAGGALSGYFSLPSYQSSLTGVARRSVPDLALNADPATGVNYIINNNNYIIGGTSIVSPAMAGYLASINAKVFINPLLYTTPTGFRDVLVGSNGGFTAKTGYDNCSGLGSIIGNVLTPVITGATPPPPTPTPTPPTPTPPTPTVINVSSVSLNHSSFTLSLRRNRTTQLTTTILPANATNKAIIWSSSNSRTSRVSSTGLVTGLRIGTCQITVRTVNQNKRAVCNIIVTA
jgi:kumamolisin